MLRAVLLVGLGGGVGSILRFLTNVLLKRLVDISFPLHTFVVNLLGCLVIGLLVGLFERYDIGNSDLRHLLVIGFCGGYTTFSTFALENMQLVQSGNLALAFVYIAASVITGLLAVWLGICIVK